MRQPQQGASMVSTSGTKRRPPQPTCEHCRRFHLGECRMNSKAYFKCGSKDHFIRDYPKMRERTTKQSVRGSTTPQRDRFPSNTGGSGLRPVKDVADKLEVRRPQTYAIRT